MSYKLIIARPARQDMEAVLDWTLEQFGETQQDEYAELIQAALFEIERDPTQSSAKLRDDLHKDVRTYHIAMPGRHARHMLVFRLHPMGVIEIGRFLHDAMDIARHVPPDFRRRRSPRRRRGL